jgi:hypothetical protein
VVEVFKDGPELRVRVVLEFPAAGGTNKERNRAWSVAKKWQWAIRARAGTKHDFALCAYNAFRNLEDSPSGYGEQVILRNEAIAILGRKALDAGESWEARGPAVQTLLEELALWFPNSGEPEQATRQVLSRIRAGKPVPWTDAHGDEQPVNKDRIRNRLTRADDWMPATYFEPIDPDAVEESWRSREASVMGVYLTRLGWSAEQLPPGRATAKDEGSEQKNPCANPCAVRARWRSPCA